MRKFAREVLSFGELTTLLFQIDCVPILRKTSGVASKIHRSANHRDNYVDRRLGAFPTEKYVLPNEINECSPQRLWFVC